MLMLLLTAAKSFSSEAFIVDGNGSPIISPTQVEQKIRTRYSVAGLTVLKVKPAEPYITNLDNPSIKIPVDRLYLNRNSSQSMKLSSDVFVNIYNENLQSVDIDELLRLTLRDIGTLPAGLYSIDLEFVLITGANQNSYNAMYPLRFEVPRNIDISTSSPEIKIMMKQDDVLNLHSNVSNELANQIVINANMPWTLCLDTSNLGDLKGDYYFQVKSAQGAVSGYETQRQKLQRGQKYQIASGTQTSNNIPYGGYRPTTVVVEYTRQHTDNRYLPAGTYMNSLIYSIEDR